MKKRPLNTFFSVILLFAFSVIIALIAPREKKFKYSFTEGKPWAYELLTAPFVFPILKSEARLSAERDSIRKSIMPYYDYSEETLEKALATWENDYQEKWDSILSDDYYAYTSKLLEQVYRSGIISDEELNKLREEEKTVLNLIESDQVITPAPISRFYSVKEAYLTIIDGIPAGLDKAALERTGISNLLKANVSYNQKMSSKVMGEEMLGIPLSTGLVQVGERIVDKGDIVNAHTYDILTSFKAEYEERSGGALGRWTIFMATLILVFVLYLFFLLYLHLFRKHFLLQIKNLVFVVFLSFLLIAITEFTISLDLFNVYLIPFAMLPIMTRTFFDSRTALIAHLITVLMAALFVPYPLEFIILQIIAGMVAVFSLRSLTSRASLIRTTFLVFSSYLIILFVFRLWQDGEVGTEYLNYILYFAINLIFLMFTYLLVYLVERIFGYVSVISLVEMGDINSKLLKQLSEVAPGTFQHSFQVSILGTEAAARIGADAQLVRTGALYHDIGKMKNPSYFTENQGSVNPHDTQSYDESSRIIIRHVTDGIAMAQHHKLPTAIIDFIRTHHGKGTTKYFYNSYCNEHPGEAVDPTPFTYPGPNPFSRETAILMLADAVEASSRSLSEYTEETIQKLIDRIVDGIIAEGLLNDAPITLRDTQVVKQVFFEKLKTMYHSRIAYPDKK